MSIVQLRIRMQLECNMNDKIVKSVVRLWAGTKSPRVHINSSLIFIIKKCFFQLLKKKHTYFMTLRAYFAIFQCMLFK